MTDYYTRACIKCARIACQCASRVVQMVEPAAPPPAPCPFCRSSVGMVDVAGHRQCKACGQVTESCCGDGVCDT